VRSAQRKAEWAIAITIAGGDALARHVAQAGEQAVRAERQDVVEVAADRRRRAGRGVDLDARQHRPRPRQQIVLDLRRQPHLGGPGGVGDLLAVRERVLDQAPGLLGDGLRQLDVGVLNGRAERAAPSAATPALRVRTGATTQQSWRARARPRCPARLDLRRAADLSSQPPMRPGSSGTSGRRHQLRRGRPPEAAR
jgi:hypothetical protein